MSRPMGRLTEKVMPAGASGALPTNSGVALPFTSDGYPNNGIAYTQGMKKLETLPPPKIVKTRVPTIRDGAITWNRRSQDADVYFGTQRALADLRYSPDDSAARSDPTAYRVARPLPEPKHRQRHNFLREATSNIPNAVIINERPAVNLYQVDDPSELTLAQARDPNVYKKRQTVRGEIPPSQQAPEMAKLAKRMQRAARTGHNNTLMNMIRYGGDYDQGTYPHGLYGVFAGGAQPGTIAENAITRPLTVTRPMDIATVRAKAAKEGVAPSAVPTQPSEASGPLPSP